MENTTEIAPAPAPFSPSQTSHSSTAKDFFLWLGFIITFFASVTSLVTLIFSYIDIAYPDTVSAYSYSNGYPEQIPYMMATLIVMAPVAALLMYIIRRDIRKDFSRSTFWVRRWGVNFIIFISGLFALGDLVTLITAYLNGQDTHTFLLKTAIVFLVSVSILLHFLAESWGYWVANKKKAYTIGIAVLVLCILTVIAGFLLVGTPATIRLQNLDAQKVNDLNDIASNLSSYWDDNNALPRTLAELHDSTFGYDTTLIDSQTKQPYAYSVLSANTYKLCAVFNLPTSYLDSENTAMSDSLVNWHGKGSNCFTHAFDSSTSSPDTIDNKASK